MVARSLGSAAWPFPSPPCPPGRTRMVGHRFVVGLEARRDVDPGKAGQGTEDGLSVGDRRALGRGHDLVHLTDHLFAVAQHEGIDEVGQGLGVEGTVSAGHHDRVVRRSVGAVDGDTGQIDQVEDVGVDQLGRKVEGQDVERPAGQGVLEREQGNADRPHGRLHVHPRGIGPFRYGVVAAH